PYPPARSNLGMVYCNETNEIIVYGGGQAIDTWSFDCETQTWSEIVTVTNPGIHYSHAMAYDDQSGLDRSSSINYSYFSIRTCYDL
ncbi:MAG: hypothetical protein ACXABF_16420, partial [Candidatus Thorarchaeota archaeon]